MTVGNVLDDIQDMERILSCIKLSEENSSYYEIWYSDLIRLRAILGNYKSMLCDLEIKEKE